MTNRETIKEAGKRIAATASGRAFKDNQAPGADGPPGGGAVRPKNREVEDEMVKIPDEEGKPPKPATEPDA
jgi:hypothetical protein